MQRRDSPARGESAYLGQANTSRENNAKIIWEVCENPAKIIFEVCGNNFRGLRKSHLALFFTIIYYCKKKVNWAERSMTNDNGLLSIDQIRQSNQMKSK